MSYDGYKHVAMYQDRQVQAWLRDGTLAFEQPVLSPLDDIHDPEVEFSRRVEVAWVAGGVVTSVTMGHRLQTAVGFPRVRAGDVAVEGVDYTSDWVFLREEGK